MGFKTAPQQRSSTRNRGSANTRSSVLSSRVPTFDLQRTIGNSATTRLLTTVFIQPKLTVSQPDDVHEREADQVADQVMRMPEPQPRQLSRQMASEDNGRRQLSAMTPSVLRAAPSDGLQRKCSCETSDTDGCECEKSVHALQRRAVSSGAFALDSGSLARVLRSSGRPLDTSTRSFMESRFERDFNSVRIHTGDNAAASAHAVNAQAYTVGSNVVFGAGRFRPETYDGRRLIAHELTHTIQQSALRSPSAANLQRSPDPPPKPKPLIVLSSPKDPDPLLFSKPFQAGPIDLSKPGAAVGQRIVTESNIVEWAAQHIWNNVTLRGGSSEKDRLVKLLRRGEGNDLHALWRSQGNSALMLLAPSGFAEVPGGTQPKVQVVYPKDNPFSGSETARSRWAKYLFANWEQVNAKLDEKVTDLFVERIKGALRSNVIPAGARLVSQPARIKQIEDEPEKARVQLGRWGDTASVGFLWMGKRMKSASTYSLVFEVIGHEGVYFEISISDFQKTDPFTGKVTTNVVNNTKGIVVVGQFLKGFLNALASPVLIVLDTAAKVLDMATMAVSAFGKWRGWYDVGYTCLSSTCRNYEECLGTKSTEECKSDVLGAALEEATIIIPLYRQGSECLGGDAEACGAIAALALGLVEGGVRRISKRGEFGEAAAGAGKGGKPLTRGELQDALIREAIDRPRPEDPGFAKALERPKAPKETTASEPRLEITKPSPPKPRIAEDLATERVVHDAASHVGSEVKLGDGTHGVAAAGKGKRAGFHFCSNHCSLVADKLEQIEKVLPEKSDIQRDVSFLKDKVRGLDNEVKAGRLTQEMADRAAQDIAKGLREHTGTAIFDTLLQMSVEDIQANRASLKAQVSRAFELGKEITEQFAEAGKKGVKKDLPEGTGASGTTTKPRTAVLTDAEMLAAKLSKEVASRPPGHEAHHIIPKGMKEAAEARRILEKAEIGINDAENGIWLPRDTAVANPFAGDIHSRVHTARAIRIMTEQLREGAKEGPAGVRRALRRIQLILSDLKFER
ncbi:MAG: eCIS core domain-containing protein [Pyrinomonadaceae bacterium]